MEQEVTTNNNVAPVENRGVPGIPEKKFEYEGISGDDNNPLPNPVKADTEESDEMEKSFATLRNLVKNGGSVEDINKAFSTLGSAVETQYAHKSQPSGGVDLAAIEQVVRSVVQPLQLQIETLKAQMAQKNNTVSNEGVVKSRALTLQGYPRAEDLVQRAAPQQPQRQLTEIEKIAYRSTGAIR